MNTPGKLPKHRIPRPEPKDLLLESLVPDDPGLPAPRGRIGHRPKEKPIERHKLEATKAFGGLLPTIGGPQRWQCPGCQRIYSDRPAGTCCGQPLNQIQTCQLCEKRTGELFRIGACRCSEVRPR